MGLLATPEDFAQMMLGLKSGTIVRVTTRNPRGSSRPRLTRYGAVVRAIKGRPTSLQCLQVVKTPQGFRSSTRSFTVFDTQLETLSLLA